MRSTDAVIAFLEHAAGVTGLTEKDLVNAASPAVKAAILGRLTAVIPTVITDMTRNGWFPLPCQRREQPPWHTLVGSAIYYLVERTIMEHGLDNAVAGILEQCLLPDVEFDRRIELIIETPGIVRDVSTEHAYLQAVSEAIADSLVGSFS